MRLHRCPSPADSPPPRRLRETAQVTTSPPADAQPGGATPRVSVVICAYTLERWDDIAGAVDSVLGQQSSWDRELILVVDHNPALASRAARELPGARTIESRGPRGLSGARNEGVGAASGSVVAFLDDDARAEPGWLEGLLAPFAEDRVVGTGGHAEAAWDTGRPRWFPEEFDWVVGCSYRGLPRTMSPIRNPLGCSMAFRTEAIRAAGGFRTEVGRVGRFPTGGEETELSIRITTARPGSLILHIPQARVLHRVTRARANWRYFRSRCYQEGRSKALISAMQGEGAALASERSYVARTLPAGILRHLGAALRGDLAGVARAGAIVAGAVLTAMGYVAGRTGLDALSSRPGSGSTASDLRPS